MSPLQRSASISLAKIAQVSTINPAAGKANAWELNSLEGLPFTEGKWLRKSPHHPSFISIRMIDGGSFSILATALPALPGQP